MKNSLIKNSGLLIMLTLTFLTSACKPVATYQFEDRFIRLELTPRWQIEKEPDGIIVSCRHGCFQSYKNMPHIYIGLLSSYFETPDDAMDGWQKFVKHDAADPEVLSVPQTDSLAGYPAVRGTLGIERTLTVSPLIDETALHIRDVWVVDVDGTYLFIVGNMSFATDDDYQSREGDSVLALIDTLIRDIAILPMNNEQP